MPPFKKISLLIIVLPAVVLSCAHKVSPAATKENTYTEDLSSTLPKITPYKSPQPFNVTSNDTISYGASFNINQKLNVLLDSIISLNKRTQFSQLTIMVYNGNSRELADQTRLDVFRLLPGSKPTLDFVAPSYRVKVGRYFNEIEAYQTLQKLKSEFPNAIVVPEPVYFK